MGLVARLQERVRRGAQTDVLAVCPAELQQVLRHLVRYLQVAEIAQHRTYCAEEGLCSSRNAASISAKQEDNL